MYIFIYLSNQKLSYITKKSILINSVQQDWAKERLGRRKEWEKLEKE